ncbi:ABC1 domain-containing protein, partial [Haematococcus lacustris]
MKYEELFEWLERAPVASGSIGQIHRAKLSEKGAALTGKQGQDGRQGVAHAREGCRSEGFQAGQVVAVKVRHPGVADTILRDFSTMLALARCASAVPALAHLRLEDTLKQFAAPLKEQVDLAREASNLQRFNYNFRNTAAVQFPVPLYPLVSSE